ncbi:MAG: hypothetical protein IJZ62_02595 [Clostridia bacterium]|nr:hypothetical protein [Clostridia bacterium]
MKKGWLRNFFDVIIWAIVGVAIASLFLFAGSEIAFADYSSTQQTIDLQEILDVDAGYRQSNYARLQHNDDQPIYVSLEEDVFSQTQIDTIVSALDYIFGIVGQINDNYQYKIVDNVNNGQYLGKSRIHFTVGDFENANGCAKRNSSIFGFGSKGIFNQDCKVVYDKDFLTQQPSHFFYTTLHELLHIFGMDDVYDNKVEHLDTFMNVFTDDSLKMITPNDYKLLVACYAKDLSALNEEDRAEYIKSLQQKIEDYSVKYYSYYSQREQKNRAMSNLDLNCSITMSMQEKQSEESLDLTFNVCLTAMGQKVRVVIEENSYNVYTFSENGKLVENCEGEVFEADGEIFLQGVHLQDFKEGKETFVDLYIFKTGQLYNLCDVFNNCYSNDGITTENYAN